MTRFHKKVGIDGSVKRVAFTQEEELARDAEEAEEEAEKPKRLWEDVRRKRNRLLVESDWISISDVPLSEADKDKWKIYRQKLRDIPQTFEDPENIIWPKKPK